MWKRIGEETGGKGDDGIDIMMATFSMLEVITCVFNEMNGIQVQLHLDKTGQKPYHSATPHYTRSICALATD